MESAQILVVDDSQLVLRLVKTALEDAGYEVRTAASGEEALDLIHRFGLPHLALVDINMPPGMDGFEFCETVHAFSDLPVIMLTAASEESTIVQALNQFAEDYITKPFNIGELIARVRRVLRRVGSFSYRLQPIIQIDDWLQVDFVNKQAVVNGKPVSLTPTETKLLYILLRHAGRTVTTEFVLQRLWPLEIAQEDRLRVYIHRLRRKIEADADGPHYITSERGVGYSFAKN